MRAFGELLTEHTTRTGISDAELARTLGVSRQTIFRWKEGLVAKPRYREDVLKIAARLRLTPDERDELLLAAGFPPETGDHITPKGDHIGSPLLLPPALVEPVSESDHPSRALGTSAESLQPAPMGDHIESPLPVSPALPAPLPTRTIPRWAFAVVALLVFLVIAAVAAFAIFQPSASPAYPTAAPGETLIVIGAFGAAAPTPTPTEGRAPLEGKPLQTFDAGARLQAALERESQAARLERVRVVRWRDGIRDAGAAESVRQRTRAGVVIGGARDGDHLALTLVAAPPASRVDDLALDALVSAPSSVRMKIALASSEEMQMLALFVLSQVYLDRGEFALARATLTLALSRPPADADALAALHFQLGYVHQISKPPDLNQALQGYQRALDLSPQMLEAYLNRGVARIRQNAPAEWQADFARVLALKPDHAGARQSLCWAHALDKQADLALPHCDAAARADPTGRSREARGIVYAGLGRLPDAAADLQSFLDWLAQQPESLRARYGSSRAEWVLALRAGKNPIDEAVLERLRQE